MRRTNRVAVRLCPEAAARRSLEVVPVNFSCSLRNISAILISCPYMIKVVYIKPQIHEPGSAHIFIRKIIGALSDDFETDALLPCRESRSMS